MGSGIGSFMSKLMGLNYKDMKMYSEAMKLLHECAILANESGFKQTPVFAFSKLGTGNMIKGPALIEAKDTTYVIEPGWQFSLDAFHNAVLDRV